MIVMSKVTHGTHGDGGAAAVEFALVSIALVILLTGIIQFGYLFFEYIQVAHAAREGARWGALGSSSSEVAAKARAAAPGLGSDLSVDPPVSDGESISVTVTHPVTRLMPIPDVLLPGSVSSTAVQRIE
jgi:Flp pilus assembly protein TadG